MSAQKDIAALTDCLRAIFVSAEEDAARRIAGGWPAATHVQHIPEPNDLPVTGWLGDAVAHASAGLAGLAADLATASDGLRWQQTYSAEDLGQYFLDRYGWVLLVGPDAPSHSDSLLAGFLFLGPDVEYPVHQHSAEEVYVVLSGRASWKIGDADWQVRPAGSVVHNPPWQWHGMRTDQGEPLLIGFMWNAGTVEKSKMTATDQAEGN